MAISLRKSGDLLPPTAAFLSRDVLSSSSNLSRSSPLPVTGTSAGRRGDSCLGKRGETVGGGDSKEGLKLSESVGVLELNEETENGEKGSASGSCGGAREIEISGTRERASMTLLESE